MRGRALFYQYPPHSASIIANYHSLSKILGGATGQRQPLANTISTMFSHVITKDSLQTPYSI
jgi:hypothetical protein